MGDKTENAGAAIKISAKSRNKIIIKTSIVGILSNIFLSILKAVSGIVSHSIAIVLDAVNNLSDAASSIITIVGAKLAVRAPDKEHPFGHGRIEYLSAMLISVIVLYAGLTSLVESIKKIIEPVAADYSPAVLIAVSSAVFVKIFLGLYFKKVGKKVRSDSLINSGQDALLDAVIALSTLTAAAVYLIWGVSLEAWLAAAISLIIIRSGVSMLRKTLSRILGESADAALSSAIKETVCSFPDVTGAYDLVLHNYGPDMFTGSIHISIPDTYSAGALDSLIREITAEVYRKHNVYLTAIGIYPVNTRDKDVIGMLDAAERAVYEDPDIHELHGFYVDENKKTIRVDLVVAFTAKDRSKTFDAAVEKIRSLFPDYEITAVMDADYEEE